ncbi:MAG: hypothetical protein CL609_09155 [Anaerolineaceae bacterium]|nr:hypothetical protein [Anaerolineaceae bacterium]
MKNYIKNNKTQKLWKVLPGIFISIFALIYIFNLITFSEIKEYIKTIDFISLLLAFIVMIVGIYFKSLGWWVILGKKAPIVDTFLILNIGNLLNNLLPFRAGEFGKAYMMGKKSGMGSLYIFSSIIIERFFDMLISVFLILSVFPSVLKIQNALPYTFILFFLIIMGFFILIILSKNNQKVVNWLKQKLQNNEKLEKILVPKLESFLLGLGIFKNISQFLQSFFWIILAWLFYILFLYILILQFFPTAKFWWALFLQGIISSGLAIPSVPGSIGVYEAAAIGALFFLGINKTEAAAFAIVTHGYNIFIIILIGLISFILLNIRNKRIK